MSALAGFPGLSMPAGYWHRRRSRTLAMPICYPRWVMTWSGRIWIRTMPEYQKAGHEPIIPTNGWSRTEFGSIRATPNFAGSDSLFFNPSSRTFSNVLGACSKKPGSWQAGSCPFVNGATFLLACRWQSSSLWTCPSSCISRTTRHARQGGGEHAWLMQPRLTLSSFLSWNSSAVRHAGGGIDDVASSRTPAQYPERRIAAR